MKNRNQNSNSQTFSGKRNGGPQTARSDSISSASSDSIPIEALQSHAYSDNESDLGSYSHKTTANGKDDEDEDDDDEDEEDGSDKGSDRSSKFPIGSTNSRLPSKKKAQKFYRNRTTKPAIGADNKSKINYSSIYGLSDSANYNHIPDLNPDNIEDLNDLAVLDGTYTVSDDDDEDSFDNQGPISYTNNTSGKSRRIKNYHESDPQDDAYSDNADDEEDNDDSQEPESAHRSAVLSGSDIDSVNNLNDSDDSDDSDESEDSDMTDSDSDGAFRQKKKTKLKRTVLKPPARLEIPKLLDPSTFRISNASSSNSLSGTASPASFKLASVFDDDDDDDISDLSVMSESELDALEASITQFRRRRDSVVDQSLDDRTLFPRSAIPEPINEEAREDDDEEAETLKEDTSYDVYNEDEDDRLLAMMDSDFESSTAEADPEDEIDDEDVNLRGDNDKLFYDDDDDDEDIDDFVIEQEEERALVEEVERSGDLSAPPSPTLLGYESDEDDGFETDLSFNEDVFLSRTIQESMQQQHQQQNQRQRRRSVSVKLAEEGSDDDEYLWSYFFTSDEGESSDDEKGHVDQEITIGLSGLNDEIYTHELTDYSGESTDEDESIPRNVSKTPSSKPTEILSSSNTVTRPPVLGSWVMSNERPYGIIDGRTTRTLSPQDSNLIFPSGADSSRKRPFSALSSSSLTAESPLARRKSSKMDEDGAKKLSAGSNSSLRSDLSANFNGKSLSDWASKADGLTSVSAAGSAKNKTGDAGASKKSASANSDDDSESDLSVLALDDFIYTSELDDEDDSLSQSGAAAGYDTLYGRLSKRDIPLSAFRNRSMSIVYEQASLQNTSSVATPAPQGKQAHLRTRRGSTVTINGSATLSRRSSMIKSRRSSSIVSANGLDTGLFAGLVLPPAPSFKREASERTDMKLGTNGGESKRRGSEAPAGAAGIRAATADAHSVRNGRKKKRRRMGKKSKLMLEGGMVERRNNALDDLGDLDMDVDLLAASDLVDDMVGLGALSPLFGGIA